MTTSAKDIKVNEIFYSIQGEGPLTGTPSVFVRLSGCTLNCQFCDSKYHVDGKMMSPKDIADEVLSYRPKNVVLTGGEPLLQQKKIKHLRDELMFRSSAHIEIETNGTIAPLICLTDGTVSFNVSPKLTNSGMSFERRYKGDILQYYVKNKDCQANFKFVVASPKDISEITTIVSLNKIPNDKIYLMPEGATREEVIDKSKWVIGLCKTHGWKFSSRLHVLLWSDERGK